MLIEIRKPTWGFIKQEWKRLPWWRKPIWAVFGVIWSEGVRVDRRDLDGGMKMCRAVGWISNRAGFAPDEARKLLIEMGVQGKIAYNPDKGSFEHCEIHDVETLERLEKEWPGFWVLAFTYESELLEALKEKLKLELLSEE